MRIATSGLGQKVMPFNGLTENLIRPLVIPNSLKMS